jgi:hypothetical protein
MSSAEGSITKEFVDPETPTQVITTDLWVKSYMIQPHDSNLAKMYIGDSTLQPSIQKWYAWLPIPSSKAVETFNNNGPYAHSFNLKELYVSGNSGEGCVITYNRF